ncbi:hypothetical protein BKA61DRAFT_712358 [Leptodontidium sp. MPI-SDFR-AT-0119]|nr:hypothetical protein BKA61DRAFT_712358 [Leptodontidium sp. MPI-SDFR-AT-0119]
MDLLWGLTNNYPSARNPSRDALFMIQSPLSVLVNRADQVEDVYDYVIVGGGTAGLTVGDRLSESGRYTVLVIEYGVLDNSTAILNGGVLGGGDPSRQFDIPSVPQPELNNRSINVRDRKAVGGSSTINGLQFLRGTSDEYDMCAGLGAENSTWNWAGLLPYFKKASTPIQNSVHFVSPLEELAREFKITYDVDAAWGQDPSNQLYAGYPNYQPPEIKLRYDAMHKIPNVDFPRDENAGTNGLYWYPSTMDPRTYTRSYALTGHWDNISRSNYQLITGSKVNKVLFDGDVATGVTLVPVNGSEKTTATLEGQHNGEGRPSRSWCQLPRPLIYSRRELQVDDSTTNSSHKIRRRFKYDANSQSRRISRPPCHIFWRRRRLVAKYEIQDSTDYLPKDTHANTLAGYKAQNAVFTRILKLKNVSMLWQILQANPRADPVFQHPVSRGTVNVDHMNSSAEPIVDYRAFSNPFNIEIIVQLIRFVRRFSQVKLMLLMDQSKLVLELISRPTLQLKAWVKEKYVASVYHPVGTASLMRRELGGVVGEDLLVYGVRGLSVVDASVIPIIPGCPTALTVYTTAEKVS